MARSGSREIDDYIARQSKDVQPVLRRVRSILLRAIPEAEEVISYKIPAIKVRGRIALFYAGWTEHYAIYPASHSVFREFSADIVKYESGKGTIRFPVSKPVPAKLIERIARYRARELTPRAKAKVCARKSIKSRKAR